MESRCRWSWPRGAWTIATTFGLLLAGEAHAQTLEGTPIAPSFSQGCFPGQEVVVRDGLGRLYVAVSNGPSYLNLQAHIHFSDDAGSTWSVLPGFVMNALVVCRSPHLAVDSRNRLHVAWHESESGGGDLHFRHRAYDPALGWLPIERMSTVGLNGGRQVSLAVDSRDDLHAVWQDSAGQAFYSTRPAAGGAWTPELSLGQLGPQCHVAIDHADDVHVIGGYGGRPGIAYRSRIGGVWGPIERISVNSLDRHADLALDSANGVHVTWTDTVRLFYRARQPGPAGAWGPTTELTLREGHPAGSQGGPIAIDVDDNLVVMTSCCPGQLRLFRKPAGSPDFLPVRTLKDPDVSHEMPSLRSSVWPLSNRVRFRTDLHFVWRSEGVLRFGGLAHGRAGRLALYLPRSHERTLPDGVEIEILEATEAVRRRRLPGVEGVVRLDLPPTPAVVLIHLFGDGSRTSILATTAH